MLLKYAYSSKGYLLNQIQPNQYNYLLIDSLKPRLK